LWWNASFARLFDLGPQAEPAALFKKFSEVQRDGFANNLQSVLHQFGDFHMVLGIQDNAGKRHLRSQGDCILESRGFVKSLVGVS